MFGASADHPILNSALNETLYLLENPSVYGLNLSDCSNHELTDIIYGIAFVGSFNRFANINTKDLAIPPYSSTRLYTHYGACESDDPAIFEEIKHYFESNIKSYYLAFGRDGSHGQSWSEDADYHTLNIIKQHRTQELTEYDEFSVLEVFDKAQFNFSKVTDTDNRYKNLEAPITDSLRIPKISHFIWLSSYESPKEVSDQDLKSMISTLQTLQSDETDLPHWKHYLWTTCIVCIPKTMEKLSEYGVIPKHFSESDALSKSYNIIDESISHSKFGIASDFVRMNILKEIGGIYFDLNYMLQQSPIPYMKTYDFLAHSDRGGAFADVYMIAAKPHHPILEEATATILENFQNPPTYLQEALNLKLHIQDLTGLITYIPFNMAVYNHLNVKTIDFIFPLEIKDGYPENAKKPEVSIDLIEKALDSGFCANLTDASSLQVKECAMANAFLNEICVDNILGFDSTFGNSWFNEPALYY